MTALTSGNPVSDPPEEWEDWYTNPRHTRFRLPARAHYSFHALIRAALAVTGKQCDPGQRV